MNQHETKRLGVVGLEATDDEFNRGVFLQPVSKLILCSSKKINQTYHVGKGKARHVEENSLFENR